MYLTRCRVEQRSPPSSAARCVLALALLGAALPASASREVESLRLVGDALGWFLRSMIELTLVLGVFSAMAALMWVWLAQRKTEPSSGSNRRPANHGQNTPAATPAAAGPHERQAQAQACAEALVMRPATRATAPVDQATRDRIAAAARRLETAATDAKRLPSAGAARSEPSDPHE